MRMREILLELRERKIFTVVGGAYASVDEEFFDGLCDVLFTGEADETWPKFVEQICRGPADENFYKQARADRHDQLANAPIRSAQSQTLRDGVRAVFARLPVSMRVLRHHRDLWPPAAR